MKKMNNKGFSLVELIIVIAIMAVLIGVLAPQFIKYVERSRESTDLQNVEEVKTAVEAYVADHGEDMSGSIVVEVNTAKTQAMYGSDDLVTKTPGLGEYGIDSGKKLKSKKWTDNKIEWTYSLTNYKWTPTAGSATYFYVDGTPKS